MGARLNAAISRPGFVACGVMAGVGIGGLALGVGGTAAAGATGGLSLAIGLPATTAIISTSYMMASSGLGCMSGLLFNAAMGGGDGPGENGGYGRGGQKLKPSPAANGADHTAFKTDVNGKVTSYETFTKQTNSKNPNPYESKRFDGTHPHNGIQPHVHDMKAPNKVRKPELNELPKGY